MVFCRKAAALAALLCTGCNPGDKGDAKSPPAEPAPASPEDELTVATAVPLGLTCSAVTSASYVSEAERADDLTACSVRNGKGAILDVQAVTLRAERGGAAVATEPVPKETVAPWHQAFRSTPAERQAQTAILADVTAKDGKSYTVRTDNDRYDWTKDPAFAEFLEAMVLGFQLSFKNTTFDATGQLAQDAANGGGARIAFASDKTFRGDFTVAEADAYCAEAGKKVDAALVWRAFLADGVSDPRVRSGYGTSVFNVGGHLVATRAELESGRWTAAVAFTESGAHVMATPLPDSSPPKLIHAAWTGVAPDMSGDGARNCAGWTSASSSVVGRTIGLYKRGAANRDTFSEGRLLACSEEARIVCLSNSRRKPIGFRSTKNVGRMIFATADVHPGNIGVQKADEICAAAGAKLFPGIRAQAVLSTSTAPLRTRLPLVEGRVRNYQGTTLSDGPDPFYDGSWSTDVIFVEDGRAVGNAIVPSTGRYEIYAWTGTAKGGGTDTTLGTCDDWTSASPERTGRVLLLDRFDGVENIPTGSFALEASRPCSATARLLCLTEDPGEGWE